MKKLIALLLAMLMLLGLAACSSGTPSWEKDREEDNNDVVIVDEEDDEDEDEDDIVIDDDEDEPSINTEGMFIPGTVRGTTYENEFIGIGAKFGDGWEVQSGNDLNSSNGIPSNLSDEEVIEKLNETYVFYDLMALAPNNNPNVNIAIENLPMANAGNLTPEEYLDIVKPSLENTLYNSGYEEVYDIEETTASFAGGQCPALLITGYANNQDVCQYMLFTKADELMVLITVTCSNEQTAVAVTDLFYAID